MKDADVRVGVIGTGYWGRNLVRNFHELGALAGLSDINAAVREDISAGYPEAHMYEQADQMLGDPGIDAIAIATPAATHGDLVDAALRAGKHVFVEKPMCLEVDQAEHLRDTARTGRLTLMVGHLLLYHPAFCALQHIVESPTAGIGQLRYIYSNRLSLGRIRREENALWSFAPHDVSMILALMGEMPERVTATGSHHLLQGVHDTTLSHLSFPGGVQAHIFVSWLHPYKDHRMVVVGESGMIVFDDVSKGPDKLLLYRHAVGWDGDIPFIDKAEAVPVPYDIGEPLRVECSSFVRCVVDGTTPPSDADEGIRVLRVLKACQQAIRDTGSVPLLGRAGE